MEVYIIKDSVELIDLEKWHKEKRHKNSEPYMSFQVGFPNLVKPVDQSRSSRLLAGKLKDVVQQFVYNPYASFYFSLYRKLRELELLLEMLAEVTFHGYLEDEDECIMNFIFGKENFKIKMSLALCHLPTKDTPVKSDNLIILGGGYLDQRGYRECYCEGDTCGFKYDDKKENEQLEKLWRHQTGWIYLKLTVCVELNEEGVEKVVGRVKSAVLLNKVVELNRKMLEGEICTDLEIVCGDGKIVKGHRGIVGGSSEVFKVMLEVEGMEEKRTGRVEMEWMSEQGVRALLAWIYWRDDKEALMDSGVAVELLIAGDKYEVEALVEEMKDIILKRMGKDDEWFCVESALELLGWARNTEDEQLREKAVGVLKFFWKTFPEKFDECEEYQEWVKSNPELAKEVELNSE